MVDVSAIFAKRQRLLQQVKAKGPGASPQAQAARRGTMQALQRLKDAGAVGSAAVSDVERILGLPLDFPLEAEEEDYFNRTYLLPQAYAEGRRFLASQVNGIFQYLSYQGGFLQIGVGQGKSLLSLVAADQAFRRGCERILLMCPPALVPKLMDTDLRFAREMVPLGIPVHCMHGRSQTMRLRMAKRRPRGLFVFPYSLASQADCEEALGLLKPDIVIADEAHRLANFNAARTRRFSRFMEEHKPQFVCMSGTITAKSLMDYAHLARWALGDNCFLPSKHFELAEWAEQIDANAVGGAGRNNSTTTRLVRWARDVSGQPIELTTTGFREAFRVRMATCPGVYVSPEQSVSCSLIIRNEAIPLEAAEKRPGWGKLKDLMDGVEEGWVSPCGDQIDHAMQKFRWMFELSAGMYNSLVWPSVEELAKRRQISEGEASDLLERAFKHHELGQDYAKVLRTYLETAPPGRDTPMLVGQSMYQHGTRDVPGWLYEPWIKHREADFEGRPERDSYPVRVCDWKVRHCVERAKSLPKGEGALIWCHSQDLIKWCHEELVAAGLPSFAATAGPAIDKELERISHGDPEMCSKIIPISISAHGEGKNFQALRHQIFLQWPRPARTAEQVLGRQHRTGQKADELIVNTCFSLEFDHMLFAACLNDSLYQHQSMGSPRKLILADYDPMPRLYPPEILLERGLDPNRLDAASIRLRRQKFGV